MRWVVVDVVVAVGSVAALVLAGLALWRRVRALGRDVRAASSRVGDVTRALEDLSDARAAVQQPSAVQPSPALEQSPAVHLPSASRLPTSARGA